MSQTSINFLNWRPDVEDTEHDGLSIAQNVIHDTEGYKQIAASTLNSDYSTTTITCTSMICKSIGTAGQQLAAWVEVNVTAGPPYYARLIIGYAASGPLLHATPVTSTLTGSTSSFLTAFNVTELENKVFAVARSESNVQGGGREQRNIAGFFTITADYEL